MRTREVHNPGPQKKDEAERIEIHSKNRNYHSFSASLWVHLVVISSFFPLPEFFIMFRLRRRTEKLHLMLLIFLSAAVLFFFVQLKLRYNYIPIIVMCTMPLSLFFICCLSSFIAFRQNLISNIRHRRSEKRKNHQKVTVLCARNCNALHQMSDDDWLCAT